MRSLDLLRVALLGAIAPAVACTGKGPQEPSQQPTGVDAREPVQTPTRPDETPPASPPPWAEACPGDAEAVLLGQPTGFGRCADGSVHRRTAVACVVPEAPGDSCPGGDDVEGDCRSNADCTQEPHGRCLAFPPGQMMRTDKTYCGCRYGCETDADCDDGVCLCPGALTTDQDRPFPERMPECVLARCQTDADCPSGECGATARFNGCGTSAALQCRTEIDGCRSDADCNEGEVCGANATPGALAEGTKGWRCEPAISCMIGRLLRVDGDARVAACLEGHLDDSWRGDALARTLAASPELRRELARRWREVALLEHASIASFARFSLQLLALGAPPELLAQARAALDDEREHARLCLALARCYGADARPGPLDVTRAAAGVPDRRTVAAALLREACVAETLGVAEAVAAAEVCQEPAVRSILARIASDEQRHAALAWRSLRWIVDGASPALRVELAALARVVVEEAARALEKPVPESRYETAAHGVLPPRDRAAIQRAALGEVVGPCLRAVFGADADERRAYA